MNYCYVKFYHYRDKEKSSWFVCKYDDTEMCDVFMLWVPRYLCWYPNWEIKHISEKEYKKLRKFRIRNVKKLFKDGVSLSRDAVFK